MQGESVAVVEGARAEMETNVTEAAPKVIGSSAGNGVDSTGQGRTNLARSVRLPEFCSNWRSPLDKASGVAVI